MRDPKPAPPAGAFDREINVKGIAYTVAGLAGVVALSMVLMWWLSVGLKSREMAADPPPSPLPEANQRRLPPAPWLQPSPSRDLLPEQELAQMRAEEEEALNGYGWVDPEADVARIPVARAIELVAAGGLPTWEAAPAAAPPAGEETP